LVSGLQFGVKHHEAGHNTQSHIAILTFKTYMCHHTTPMLHFGHLNPMLVCHFVASYHNFALWAGW